MFSNKGFQKKKIFSRQTRATAGMFSFFLCANRGGQRKIHTGRKAAPESEMRKYWYTVRVIAEVAQPRGLRRLAARPH